MDNYSGTFEEFWTDYPQAIPWGKYSNHLKDYLRYFERDQILVLISEQTADLQWTKDALAGFMGIMADRFPPSAGVRNVNKGYVPRARFAHSFAIKAVKKLRDWELYGIVNLAQKLSGRVRGLFKGGSLPRMNAQTRTHLQEIYADEFANLEQLLQIDLDCWRQDDGALTSQGQAEQTSRAR